MFFPNSTRNWNITPGLDLQPGKTYRFSVWASSGASPTDTLRLGIGTYPSSDSMGNVSYTDKVLIPYSPYVRLTYTFTVPVAGRYFAGTRWKGGYLDDLQLIEVPTQDAEVDSVLYPLTTSHTCFNSATAITNPCKEFRAAVDQQYPGLFQRQWYALWS